jgi:GDP-D-mannose 3', 5'-epimerase
MADKVLVTGAGGFIGHHLVAYLKDKGFWVRGVDIKYPEYGDTRADEFEILDLRRFDSALIATRGVEEVYHLAADMGGIGFITAFHAEIVRNDTQININTLESARINGIKRLLYSSSACVYPQYLQEQPEVTPLKEEDAWPADPEEGYGLEKLYMEKMLQYYAEDYGLIARTFRFHNVYGPRGTYDGGREKAPAAISRKIALAKQTDEIEVWGDGEQTRSFMYIDDCTEGIYRLMRSDFPDPMNLGTDELVTINQLVDTISEIAGKDITRKHDLSKPQGVRGRNSDNTLTRKVLGWEPKTLLKDGMIPTYEWIAEQVCG